MKFVLVNAIYNQNKHYLECQENIKKKTRKQNWRRSLLTCRGHKGNKVIYTS